MSNLELDLWIVLVVVAIAAAVHPDLPGPFKRISHAWRLWRSSPYTWRRAWRLSKR